MVDMVAHQSLNLTAVRALQRREAAYVERLQARLAAPSVKQHLAALRRLFDWLVVGQVLPANPASVVRGPRHSVRKGKTPVLAAEEARARAFLSNTPGYRQIHETLETYATNYALFPVSAVGPDRIPGRSPTHPFNLLHAFVWAADQADHGRLLAAEREAEGLPAHGALKVYERLLSDGGFSAGSVYETARARRDALRGRTSQRRNLLIAAALSALLLATSLGWDIGRAVTNSLAIILVGPAVLSALRRIARRAAFDLVGTGRTRDHELRQ